MSVLILRSMRIAVNVHLLHALDLAGLYETTELGDRLPLLLLCQMSILPSSFMIYSCVPRSCRHGDHVRVHGPGHGHHHVHHHGHREIRIHRRREVLLHQPFCMLFSRTAAVIALLEEVRSVCRSVQTYNVVILRLAGVATFGIRG
jgi:hypothetical protein